ncbi:MAG: Rne/Rng family ribonuclease [Clostridia bacterium]|nr:Rne/Rng family ribonuclease [Clostridia bacterium]
MLELYVIKKEDTKLTFLLEDGNLIEFYDEKNIRARNEGNIFIGIARNILVGMESAFVDIGTEKNGYIYISELLPQEDETNKKPEKSDKKINIKKIIKPNDRILVQVKKDSNSLKGARISTHINLPSKYIALMPNSDIVTVSQKITDEEERQRLKKLVKENLSQNNGAIIRTSAQGKTEEIIEDIKKLEELWKKIENEYKKDDKNEPKLIYKTQDIAQKILIDLARKNIQKVVSNDQKELDELKEFAANNKEFSKIEFELKTYNQINELYDLNSQIEKVGKRKVWLNCGGFITIDKTEALTAIDVNTGKFTEGKCFDDVILKVNKQATQEIAKQIRLRDIGGIIIIDYIDMTREGDQEKIEKMLKKCLKEERSKVQVEGFTKLNLMELTRKQICSHKN